MSKTVAAMICLFFFTCTYSQTTNTDAGYKNALGIKPNARNAISYRHFFSEKKVLEGLVYLSGVDLRITGLYEIHNTIGAVKGLKWYYGGGAHIGFWSEYWKAMSPSYPHAATIGPDAIVGLDYKITGLPVNISIDWQPSLNVTGHKIFEGIRGGVGLRYLFNNFFTK